METNNESPRVIPFLGNKTTETTDVQDAEVLPDEQSGAPTLKFKEGDKVCNGYFAGTFNEYLDGQNEPVGSMTIKDSDKKMDGKVICVYEKDLRSGNTPIFEQDYFYATNTKPSEAGKATYGERMVGFSPPQISPYSIDAKPEVFRAKQMCAEIIDELKYQLSKKEKEVTIAMTEPVSENTIASASMYQLKDAIEAVVLLKHNIVSALIGNNDRIN